MDIVDARVEDAAEILDLQQLTYRSAAEIHLDHDIPPLKQTLAEMEATTTSIYTRNSDTLNFDGSKPLPILRLFSSILEKKRYVDSQKLWCLRKRKTSASSVCPVR